MYKSPLEIIDSFTNDMGYKIKTETDKLVMEAVYNVGVNVDKAELIKALEYDRDQYEKGYRDGKESATVHAQWLHVMANLYDCSNCFGGLEIPWEGEITDYIYCPYCGARMDKEDTHETHKEG